MLFKCKAFVMKGEVEASEASFIKFFNKLSDKGEITWRMTKERNASIVCDIIEKDAMKILAGVIIADSTKKTGFKREGNELKEIKLNASDELNIFAINCANNKGLYSSYRGAISLNNFLLKFKRNYNSFVDEEKAECFVVVDNKIKNSPEYKKFNYHKKEFPEQLVGEYEIENILRRLRSIKELRFSTEGYDEDILNIGVDIKDKIRTSSVGISFENISRSDAKNTIIKAYEASVRYLQTGKTKHFGKVVGVDVNNNSEEINFNDFSNDYCKFNIDDDILKIDNIKEYEGIKEIVKRLSDNNSQLLR